MFDENLIPAPDNPSEWSSFRAALAAWRRETRERLGYSDALYARKEFAWAASSYSCCFLMLCDEAFYDAERGCYTPETFLEHGLREFGGYDSVVLWHAYPRIGFDDRNQFDMYRDMPGGLDGLRDVSRRLHARGVRLYVDYNPWDTGTRREAEGPLPAVSDLDALAGLVAAIEADGIFLDTMDRGVAEFRDRLDAVRPGVVLESELALPLERIHDHHLSWAQWFRDSHAPGILRNKWLERRHMQHQIQRWNRDHSAELHTAWMNGSGMMVWENVFGTWVGWSARDRSLYRAMLPVQRRFRALFSGEGWTPLVPTEAPSVYASLWEGDGLRLWTLVNRSEEAVAGPLLRVPTVAGARCFDLIRGREVEGDARDGTVTLSGEIRPRGIGAFLAAGDDARGDDFAAFLAQQAALDTRADFDTSFPARTALLRAGTSVARTRGARGHTPVAPPPGMVAIPTTTRRMKTAFRIRECGFYKSQSDLLDGTRPISLHTPHSIERQVTLARFAIDVTPVTNAQYAAFLRETGYRPRHAENFLKHWRDGAPPPGREEHPVVYVDLDDARAYALWSGKRLPAEEEWQLAAQGFDGRRYPWGMEWQEGRCNPDGREEGVTSPNATTAVTAFPDGRSPFGCYDMCGNVWEWTESERSDGRTRFCIVRGGSFYRARGSDWYADGGPQPCDFAAKYLLMWPGLDRCATIGFRCAADLDEE
jgi:formylglycine-generating enzyme required for sulfatase activity